MAPGSQSPHRRFGGRDRRAGGPNYFVSIEQRIYQSFTDPQSLVGIADVGIQRDRDPQTDLPRQESAVGTLTKPQRVQLPVPWDIKERYLEIREAATKALITVLEILSPTNKRAGQGRSLYEAKRVKVLTSQTNLVEIDLLRAGQPMPLEGAQRSQYRILVSRAGDRPQADLFAFNLQEPIPDVPIPLRGEISEPMVSLQALLNKTYQRGRLDLLIDYGADPVPGLDAQDRSWVQTLLT